MQKTLKFFSTAALLFLFSITIFAMPPHSELLSKIETGEILEPYFLRNYSEIRARGVDSPTKIQNIIGLDEDFNTIAILVDFSDNIAQVEVSFFDTLLYGSSTGTVKDYYEEVTYGFLTVITVDFPSSIGWLRAPETYAYYVDGQNGFGQYPQNAQKLAEDAVALADTFVDFSNYDNDGDGFVDALFIIHAGPGAEYTGSGDDIWSHKWEMNTPQLVDGVLAYVYSMEPEYWLYPGDMTCGVYAHEMGHAVFGLPDLYDYDYDSKGVGYWSLMAGGCWNGNLGDSPAHPDAYCRMLMEVAEITNITTAAAGVSIPEVENNPTIFRFWTGGAQLEQYFLVENRQQTGYDAYLPSNGLLVYHVDDSVETWNNNQWYPWFTSEGHYLVALEQADALWELEQNINSGNSGDPYPGASANRAFDNNSYPDSKDYDFEPTDVAITNISDSAPIMTADFDVGETAFGGAMSGVVEPGAYRVLGDISVESGDTLIVEPGVTFLFTGDFNIDIYGVFSAAGTENDSIYFQADSGASPWGSIIFHWDAPDESELSYCHITGSSASAINCYGANIIISQCTVTGNSANWGGGIYCSGCNPTISECVVTDNQSVHNGGGIYCTAASPTIINCTVTGNSSNIGGSGSGRGGGGICCNHSSSPTIEGCVVAGNYSAENGGGISINDNSHVQIIDCIISENSADSSGGGIFCSLASIPVITGCEIWENSSINGGGICATLNSDMTVDSCDITRNSASELGGGIYCDNPFSTFKRSVFSDNSAVEAGGGLCLTHSGATVDRCTIYGNSAPVGGGAYCASSAQPILKNNIFSASDFGVGIYIDNTSQATIVSYCDIHSNAGGAFGGSIPDSLGLIVTVNLNGDSCDTYSNIFLNPALVNPAGANFNLLSSSPCIDAGDPESPLDPDSTVADIGAFYFDHSILPTLIVTLTPHTLPTQIPAGGGSFLFDIMVENADSAAVNFDAWTSATLPNGSYFGPIVLRTDLNLPPGGSFSRDNLTQFVPPGAPAGNYMYTASVGEHPDTVINSDAFPFEKLPGDESPGHDFGWELCGWDDSIEPVSSESPMEYSLLPAYPNPFNAETELKFTLPIGGMVRLTVYNILGRETATLVDGFTERGTYRVSFDGSGLTSGVYFAVLRVDGRSWKQKLMLIK